MSPSILRRLFATTTVLALVVIVIGAYVRLTDAGLGCPDWPGCYGHLTSVPETAQEIEAATAQDPRGVYDAGKAQREMLHRYLAGLLGLAVFVLFLLQRFHPRLDPPRATLKALLLLILLQALLGMWTVTLQLKPLIVTLHLLGGFATLGLLYWLTLTPRSPPLVTGSSTVRHWCLAAFAAVVIQVALGGWTSSNYAALACPDFPTCQSQWWPDSMDFREAFVLWRGLGINYEYGVLDSPARTAIHVAHRLGAAVTAVLCLGLTISSLRVRRKPVQRTATVLAGLLGLQIALGILNVKWQLPLAVAVAHQGVAALLWLSLLTQWHLVRRR